MMTLGKYIRIINAINGQMDELDASVSLISAWYDISIDEAKALPISEFKAKLEGIDYSQLRLPSDAKLPYYVEIDGKKYRITQLFSEMSFGQFVDMQIALKNLYTEDGSINWNNVPNVIACFIQDENKRYVPGVDVRNMSIEDAYGIMLFFYRFRSKLEKLIQRYLKSEKTEIKPDLVRKSQLSWLGMMLFLCLQIMI
jgi:hypothetical protein